MGELVERIVERDSQSVVTALTYPEHDFSYRVIAQAQGRGVLLSAGLEQVPASAANFHATRLPRNK